MRGAPKEDFPSKIRIRKVRMPERQKNIFTLSFIRFDYWFDIPIHLFLFIAYEHR